MTFPDNTHFRHTTLLTNPLAELSASRRDQYLTTINTHKKQTSMSLAGFEPAMPVCKRPHIHTLDRAAAGIATFSLLLRQ